MLSLKETRIKEREGERLYRSLRRSFVNKFGFSWTDDETSYFDGKDIFVKYDMQVSRTREFTPSELRGLRLGHAYHEAGHAEFDYLQDYIDWQENLMANNQKEIENNEKYPANELQFFGNFGLDGRMERLVKIKCPTQAPFVDFNNYEWRFGMRLENLGESRYNDFRHAYGHRVLGMEDVELWHPEAVELLDSVIDELKEIRIAPTTKSCLEHVTALIRKVWPTLLEWNESEQPERDERYEQDNHRNTWANSSEAAQQASESVGEEGNAPLPTKEEMEQAFKRLQKMMEKEEKQIEEELDEDKPKISKIGIVGDLGDPKTAYSEEVKILPVDSLDMNRYKHSLNKVKRHIKPVSKELRGILEGVPDQVQHNAKTGRLKPNQVWRATHCDDNHIYTRNIKGEPSTNAFIGIMTDISGSTFMPLNDQQVIEHMRDSLVLLLESATLASIPNTAYAFTEDNQTEIFQLKANPNKFTDHNKAAIGGITPLDGNHDTLALQFLLNEMKSRTENIRLAIMISDGIPCFNSKESPATMTQMVKGAEKMGIDVLCLFVGKEGHALDTARIMYPGRVIHADKNVAKQLQTHVKRIMRQRK